MKHNRKPYEENLRSARTALSQQLSDRYGTTVRVQIFADLFDVQEEEWKNAIEGRMGRLKRSLITEPQYAHEAAVLFRNMKQYENVDLINSKAIADSEPDCLEGSLYETKIKNNRNIFNIPCNVHFNMYILYRSRYIYI